MRRRTRASVAAAACLTATALALPQMAGAQGASRGWKIHDLERPRPRVVTPGASVGAPPSDAIVLFDGQSLAEWKADDGSPAKWVVKDGVMQTVPRAGSVTSARAFGDMQLHIEWATPTPPVGSGQDRGNSGVIIMGKYEVQVLDSYGNTTYADGQAGALYGQHPPLVNASRPAGEWQVYDIVFRRPRFAATGALVSPARVTVLHNGVLVQDAAELWGGTSWLHFEPYAKHPDELPITLQDHDHPVRYRNIWVRPLPDLPSDEKGPKVAKSTVSVPLKLLESYVGTYASGTAPVAKVTRRGNRLFINPFGHKVAFELVPQSASRFELLETAGTVEFVSTAGQPTTAHVVLAGLDRTGGKQP